MNYFCALQRRIYDILWQNIFATKTPKHKPRLSGSGFNVPGWKTPNQILLKEFCLNRFYNAFLSNG